MSQIENDLMLHEMKTITKTAVRRRWNEAHPNHNKEDPYHQLTRKEQVIIFRLRTNHNRLREHMFTKFKVEHSPYCRFCKEDPENTNHLLQECNHFKELREDVWENPTTLQTKLFGSLRDLQRTALFVEKIGIRV